tara:strand:- start:407 stop:625 length:219 start_codon:yes stop_codon:yes gene_type:complete
LKKKPDDNSKTIITAIVVTGIGIKFFEITMENILIGNNGLLVISYLSPIIILIIIISLLFTNINLIQTRLRR